MDANAGKADAVRQFAKMAPVEKRSIAKWGNSWLDV
jgi:hypothetical protein